MPAGRHAACALLAGFWLAAILRGVDACTAEFYPTATLVTDSPLIFLGKIEAVEQPPRSNGRGGSSDEHPPTIATVRVLRVIHGSPAEGELRVFSGPLHS